MESERGRPPPKLEGRWKLEGKVVSANLDATFQSWASRVSARDLAEAKRDAEKAMIGRRQPLPDLDLDQVIGSMRWRVSQEGDQYKVTSPLEHDPKSRGYASYLVELDGPDRIVGKMKAVSRIGDKETRIEYEITGTRVK